MEQQQQTGTQQSRGRNSKKIILVIGSLCLLSGTFVFWMRAKTHIATDNAFIESPIHSVAARINGSVTQVLVADNQMVHQGDLLVVFDDRDARAEVDKAMAELALARNEVGSDRAQVEQSRAELARSRAQAVQAHLDLQRGELLFRQKVIPKEQLDRVRTNQQVAVAQVRASEEKLEKDIATVGTSVGSASGALVAKRQAELAAAELKLSYTKLCAPVDGYVTRKAVEIGNWIQPGQALMAVVATGETWITANYKERQLTDVKVGMRVRFTVDTYPGQEFFGHVDSIMAGTGAAFSLLPPENATGNYVKVTQRIPVKIAIDRVNQNLYPLRVGMSVVPTILVPKTIKDLLGFTPGPLSLTAQLIQGDDVLSDR
ncbi:MAG: HlyD family secretion protein [Desulfobulbus sp.]|nr:HlyD family secretion protein [Desulfobulbus sp.]